MSELAKSNDPRVRRAYAHAMLHRLSRGETEVDEVEDAIARADQTRKGRASDFASRLLAAERQGRLRNRPTADCDIEIFSAVTFPDGKTRPVLLAAGSHEDFEQALQEGEEFAASERAQASGRSPELLQADFAMLRLAEMSGMLPQALIYKSIQAGQAMALSPARAPED